MESGSLSAKDFAREFGKKVVLFCHVTTRIPGRENDGLLRKVGGTGFPTMVFLDASGQVLAKHTGARDAAGFSATLGAVDAYLGAKRRADEGDASAKVPAFLAGLRLGKHDFASAQKAAATLDFDAEQQKEFAGLLAGLEFDDVMRRMRPKRTRDMDRDAYMKLYQEMTAKRNAMLCDMVAAGRIPVGNNSWRFWLSVLQGADSKGDEKLMRRAIDAIRAARKDKAFERFLSRYEAKLRGETPPEPVRRPAMRIIPAGGAKKGAKDGDKKDASKTNGSAK